MTRSLRFGRGLARAISVFVFAWASVAPVIAVNAQPAIATPVATADELVGLWKAQHWSGPMARGTVEIRKDGNSYFADFAGRDVPANFAGSTVTFALPGDEGRFLGHRSANGDISGHWYIPNALVTPVQLAARGANRWRGEIAPFDEIFTFYLLITKRPDGTFNAVLRNPERDVGAQWHVTSFSRAGNAVSLMSRADDKAPEGAAFSGAYDAASATMTLVFPERGGSYDFHRDDEASGYYPRGLHPGQYRYHVPPARDDGWPVASLESEGIDRTSIEAFIQNIQDTPMTGLDSPAVQAILVARHGKLVLEEYFHGFTRDRLHDTRSAAKGVTAMIAGAAMRAGVPLRLSSPVYQVMNGGVFPAGLEPMKRAMTLEHLLTMSSGYYCDDTDPKAPGNEEVMSDQTAEPDYYRYTLQLPMATAPGAVSVYCSINPNLALGMVGRASGESPLDIFDRLVAKPMQIARYAWLLDPAGHPYGGGSVQVLPRDFLKFSQVMLNGGVWNGRRILDRDFVARATSAQYHLRGVRYGYLWWVIDYPYKDRTVRAFFAGGAGGQGTMAIPELDLVVATMAGNYSSAGSKHIQQELVPQWILPAVREKGDDPNARVMVPRDYTSPYGRSSENGPVH